MKNLVIFIVLTFCSMTAFPQSIINGRAQVKGNNIPTSGVGVEIGYNPLDGGQVVVYDRDNGAYKFLYLSGSALGLITSGTERVRILSNGNMGIGTITPDEKLSVNGVVHAKEVRIDLLGWPDFVFNKDYNLPSLLQIDEYIQKYGHLKGMPSASEVAANGIKLGEMDAKLLQKIEEMTLYLIDLNKEVNKLKNENEKLTQKINALEKK